MKEQAKLAQQQQQSVQDSEYAAYPVSYLYGAQGGSTQHANLYSRQQ